MSKYEDANLVLKLYELRRESVMRQARDWYAWHFFPQTMEEYTAIMMGENGALARMVTSYWETAAALVNHGAIDKDLFAETNGEMFGAFSKVELLIPELRAAYGPHFLVNLEKLVDSIKGGRERSKQSREFMTSLREKAAATPA